MFPLRYWANRFFALRYWPNVGAEAAEATVGTRFDLIGMGTAKFSLRGTDVSKSELVGCGTKKYPLRGS